jgi:hypothetical protein
MFHFNNWPHWLQILVEALLLIALLLRWLRVPGRGLLRTRTKRETILVVAFVAFIAAFLAAGWFLAR